MTPLDLLETPQAWPRLRPLGDAALIFEFGARIDPAIHARVLGFAAALEAEAAAGCLAEVIEWVPAFTTVTVFFDPGIEDLEALGRRLLALAQAARPRSAGGARWEIPVCFEPAFAPDLEALAAAKGLAPREVVALLTGAEFQVYMLGFLPGFPYLGGLPEACELPRLAVPRRAVPERSLAVAGRMCAVYPWSSPGGWHLLGRTPLRFFDLAQAARPALLAPGDRVRWQAIDAATYHALDELAAQGRLPRERFLAAGENSP
jgi:inhibitor of KinA